MHFIYHSYERKDTIAAIATPPGEGAIAIIRISGEVAFSIVNKLFSRDIHTLKSHSVHFGKIFNNNKEVIDEVLLIPFRSPSSYTGENSVEIHCHGGSLITKTILNLLLENGASAALPGEFTFRAFSNGKIDLAQAEAVQEIIGARNTLALKAAEEQLEGRLSSVIKKLQQELFSIAAILEAWIDFPEEGLEFASKEEILDQLYKVEKEVSSFLSSFHHGKMIKEGISLCLLGAPNVGKSSLMNALLGKERAIVTEIAGTTRDFIEEELLLGNLHFRLIDTAGIHETCEKVEKEGVERSYKAMERADLILFVLDISKGISAEERELFDQTPPNKTIAIWNKNDLLDHPPQKLPCLATLSLSAKKQTGIKELETTIEKALFKGELPSKKEITITNMRHKEALSQARESCLALINGIESDLSPELLSPDMRSLLNHLGTILGVDISEEILSSIFSKFCVGK